jgi:biopolymer transport protein ExbD
MIDVMFILIIFFLVTTTFKEEEIDHMVNLPVDARNQSLTQSTGNLAKINIRKSGAYVLMGKEVTEEQISTWMAAEYGKKPDLKVLIRSDQDAKHLYLANVMSICRHVGIARANIAVKTEK